MQRIAGQIHNRIADVTYILGPYATDPQLRQRIVEYKTRLSVNANVKPVQAHLVRVAATTKSLAGIKTRIQSGTTRTGSLGRPVTATQSLMTGRTT